MKTLTIILHYNSIQYTDVLYELLETEQGNDYELIVIDNGSDEGKSSKYSTYRLDQNIYFGGGLNQAFELILLNSEYDSLLFLNSDLIVGKNFVSSLRNELGKYDVISPSIIQPSKIQNHWRQMLNWGTKETRKVKWIDLQSPMFSRKFIEKVKKFDDLLIYGWGIDVYCGLIAEKNDMKIGVCDFVPAIHIGSATINDNKNKPEIAAYCNNAENFQWQFFQKENIISPITKMRQWAENYKL